MGGFSISIPPPPKKKKSQKVFRHPHQFQEVGVARRERILRKAKPIDSERLDPPAKRKTKNKEKTKLFALQSIFLRKQKEKAPYAETTGVLIGEFEFQIATQTQEIF